MPYMRKAAYAALFLVAAADFAPKPARAQGIPVYDNTSFLEMILQVEQGAQQLTQLEQQLQAQMQMLQSLPSNILPGISPLAASTQQLMGQIQNIGTMQSSLTANLTSLYPLSFSSGNPQAILTQITAMTAANRQAIATAMQIENQVAANQPVVTSAISSAVGASQGAAGPTAVAQATNQLLATESQQLGDLQSLLIAEQRQSEQQALQNQSEEAAAEAFNAPLVPLVPAKPF